jgi:poly(3-hydroxybutyrate) depolymerase
MGNHARLIPVLVVQGTSDLRVHPVNGDQVIQQWLHTNRGHAWTGGFWLGSFADPRGPDATRAVYSFFSRSR